MTVSCVSLHKIPSFNNNLDNSLPEMKFGSMTTPIQRPLPLTSLITLLSISPSAFLKNSPSTRLFSIKFSSSRSSIDLLPIAAANGLPPNVEP